MRQFRHGFIENLQECKDSVAYFGLTLESLLTKLVLPDKDKPVFFKLMQDKLGLRLSQEQIAEHLE
jgi:hypothetical protein